MFLALNRLKEHMKRTKQLVFLNETFLFFSPRVVWVPRFSSVPVTLSDNWGEQCGVKSCKNQPNTTICMMSEISDLLLSAGLDLTVPRRCLETDFLICPLQVLRCTDVEAVKEKVWVPERGELRDLERGCQLLWFHLKVSRISTKQDFFFFFYFCRDDGGK